MKPETGADLIQRRSPKLFIYSVLQNPDNELATQRSHVKGFKKAQAFFFFLSIIGTVMVTPLSV